jgi:hypothetical protein
MREFLSLLNIPWALTTALEVLLLLALIRRKSFNSYPWFTAYVVSTLLQSAAMFFLYRTAGWKDLTVWYIAWGAQAVIAGMRSLALVELIRGVLAGYAGIWGFSRRLLTWVALVVLAYSLVFSHIKPQWLILNFIRGLELAMAAVIVAMLLFARYYRVPITPWQRALAVGLCLYSAFYVINYSVLAHSIRQYNATWNFLGMLTFLASLLVWLHGVIRYPVEEQAVHPPTISPEAYARLSSELNLRLYLLNRQLTLLWNHEERQP